MRFLRRLWCRLCDHAWRNLDGGPSWCRRCGDRDQGISKKKFNPDLYHYKDCHDYGKGLLEETGCWCEHRGPTSHYSGGLNPGWHREKCPMVGMAWIMPPAPKDPMELHPYWKRPPCECRDKGEWGQFILTFEDGTVHGPAPRPMPREEDCITISGEEIMAILDKNKDDE